MALRVVERYRLPKQIPEFYLPPRARLPVADPVPVAMALQLRKSRPATAVVGLKTTVRPRRERENDRSFYWWPLE